MVYMTEGSMVHRLLNYESEPGKWFPKREYRVIEGERETHTFMNGYGSGGAGKYALRDDEALDRLHRTIADILKQPGGIMPPMTEQRTVIFPLYVDVDLAVPVETITDACLEKMVVTMQMQIARFYPNVSSYMDECFRALVLTKTGKPTFDPEAGTYKHGIHVHFPALFVTGDQALQIRVGNLERLRWDDWTHELGVRTPDWPTAYDVLPYSNGLRMMGAPKARRCPNCKKGSAQSYCTLCFGCNNRCIIDERVYTFHMGIRHGARDDEWAAQLRRNTHNLVCQTTTRSSRKQPMDGYVVPVGVPKLKQHATGGAGGGGTPTSGRKRGRKSAMPYPGFVDDEMRLDARYRKAPCIDDDAKKQILKRLLVRHHPLYASCKVATIKEYKGLHVMITGDDATFCLNKRGHHQSNRVYMVVEQCSKRSSAFRGLHVSYMKCFCGCATPRPGPEALALGSIPPPPVQCSQFQSPMLQVPHADVEVLFPADVASSSSSLRPPLTGSSGAESSSMEAIARRLEELSKTAVHVEGDIVDDDDDDEY